jgi:hypothetical protein
VYVENSWPLFLNGVNGEPASTPDDAFSHMARYELGRVSIGGGMSPRVIKAARVTGSYFPILAVNAAAGRLFSTTDENVADRTLPRRGAIFRQTRIRMALRLTRDRNTMPVIWAISWPGPKA